MSPALTHHAAPQRLIAGPKLDVAHCWPLLLQKPHRLGRSERFRAGEKYIFYIATYFLPSIVSPMLLSRVPKSVVAHEWAWCRRNSCRLGAPQTVSKGDRITSCAQVGLVATQPWPFRSSPSFQSGAQNQQWPTNGPNGYITLAILGVRGAGKRPTKPGKAHKRVGCY